MTCVILEFKILLKKLSNFILIIIILSSFVNLLLFIVVRNYFQNYYEIWYIRIHQKYLEVSHSCYIAMFVRKFRGLTFLNDKKPTITLKGQHRGLSRPHDGFLDRSIDYEIHEKMMSIS